MYIYKYLRSTTIALLAHGVLTTSTTNTTAAATCPSTWTSPSTCTSAWRYGFQTEEEPKHSVNISEVFDAHVSDLDPFPYDLKVTTNDSITFHVNVNDDHVDMLPWQRDRPRGRGASLGAWLPLNLLHDGELLAVGGDSDLDLESVFKPRPRAPHALADRRAWTCS